MEEGGQGVLQLEWTVGGVPSWAEMARPSYSRIDELAGEGCSRNKGDPEQDSSCRSGNPCTG